MSSFCRTIETAQLAFGGENIQVDPFWLEMYNLSAIQSDAAKYEILDMLQSKFEIIPTQ